MLQCGPSSSKMSPLHVATLEGHTDVVHELLARGAAVNTVDIGQQRSPLHFACCRVENLAVARLLLQHRASIRSTDVDGRTPLHVAARWGAVETCRLLLSHRAEVDAVDEYGATPLLEACSSAYSDSGGFGYIDSPEVAAACVEVV